jgi:hypothetical protein
MSGELGGRKMLLDRVGLVLHRIDDERPGLLDEIGQPLRARAQQLEQPMEGGDVATSGSTPSRLASKNGAQRCQSARSAFAHVLPFIQSSFSC